MSRYVDGTIYVDTKIGTQGFKAGGREIEAAARRMSKTVANIGESAKKSLKKQTDAFIKQNQAYAQQEQKLKSLEKELEKVKKQKLPTDEFKAVGKQIDADTVKLNKLIKAQEDFLAVGGKTRSSAYKKRALEIEELTNSIRYAKGEQADMLASGTAYKIPDTSAIENKIIAERQKLSQSGYQLGTSYDDLKQKTSEYAKKASKLGKVKSKLISAFSKLGNRVKNSAKQMLRFDKNTGRARMTMGRMLAMSVLFSAVFRALSAVTGGIGEGLKNLAQYSGSTNASLSSMMSALTKLKNSFATAFSPILSVVSPILTSFINMVARAVTYVGMLIAALTGQGTFTKAVEVQQDYAKSVGDTASAANDAADATENAKKANDDYLSGLDEVNRYTTQDTSSGSGGGGTGGGGGGGGIGPSEMFETVEIPGFVNNWAEKFKEAWENADFTEIGETVGNKLKEALENIPWDGIKETAGKIGKSVATFLNGVFETPGLFTTIGNTLGEALNTAIEAAYEFVTNFHWDSFGKAIADGINGFLKTADWQKLAQTISEAIKGALTSAIELLKNVDWEELGKDIGEFLTNIDWGGILLDAIELGVEASLATWDIGKGLGKAIAEKIIEGITGKEFTEETRKEFEKVADELWDTFQSIILTSNPVGFAITAAAKITDFIDDLKEKIIPGFKSKLTSFKDDLDNKILSFKAKMSSWQDSLSNKIISFKAKMSSWQDSLKSKMISFKAKLTSFMDSIKSNKKIISFKAKITGFTNKVASVVKKIFGLATGGIYKNGKWQPIQGYASGGSPQSARLFYANENGIPELVGRIGSNTAVMNNSQIVASVAAGVYKAVVAAFGQLQNYFASIATSISNIPTALQSLQLPSYNLPQPVMATGSVIPPSVKAETKSMDELTDTLESLKSILSSIQMPSKGNTGNGNASNRVTVNVGRKTLFDIVIEEGKVVQSQSGYNPFML